jgi:hypothetical protein
MEEIYLYHSILVQEFPQNEAAPDKSIHPVHYHIAIEIKKIPRSTKWNKLCQVKSLYFKYRIYLENNQQNRTNDIAIPKICRILWKK